MSTIKAYLKLFRLPNLFTIPGDVLIGSITAINLIQAPSNNTPLILLLFTSLLLYCFGLVQNDICGYTEDCQLQRNNRPLVNKSISLSHAKIVACILAFLAVIISYYVGVVSLILVITILTTVTLYNSLLLKRKILGPISMGLCRALNILLGASIIGTKLYILDTPQLFIYYIALFSLTYIAAVSFYAQDEEKFLKPTILQRTLPIIPLIGATIITGKVIFFLISLLIAHICFTPSNTPATRGKCVGLLISNLILIQSSWLMLSTNNSIFYLIVMFSLYIANRISAKHFYSS